MRIAVVGGVASTEVLVRALIHHGLTHVKVWGYEPADATYVSGWRDLRCMAGALELPFEGFRKVSECEAALRAFVPDVLFVVGLSQIIPPSMLDIATKANVGFHPTMLPRGRGRAALAWLILQGENGAATFFELRDGVDDGPVFVQEPYTVTESEDTSDVEAKLLLAEERALDQWLPRLARGELKAIPQDHALATWLGRRTPEDGCLDWQVPSSDLLKLIRASAPPHPGAFTFCQNHKISVLKAALADRPEVGVPGRILLVHPCGSFEVQAGEGIVRVMEWRSDSGWTPRVGVLLGYYTDAEIFDLRRRLADLEQQVTALQVTIRNERQ